MIFDFIKFNLWTTIKVRTMYFWWIIKYRGKKNIPPELVFDQMAKTMNSLTEDIFNAVKATPEDVSGEEKEIMRDVLMKLGEFKQEIKNLKKNKN